MKPRILYPFAGDRIGGGPLSTLEIARGIGPDFEPVIALHKPEGALGEYLRQQNIPFESAGHIPFPPSHLNILSAVLKARDFLKKYHISIVQADDGPPRYIWFYAARLTGAKYLLTQRTLLKRSLEKNISYRFLDMIIVNSEATRRTLPPLPPSVPVGFAPPVIRFNYATADRPRLRSDLVNELRINGDEKIIGYVSQMHPRKRPDLFIRMAAAVKKSAPFPVRFIMAGAFYDGIEKEIRALIAQENLENDIHVLGYRDDPQALMGALDLFVAPASDEAFGRTLVEAMGLETLVIANADGGHREIIRDGENGFLIESGSPEAYAEKALYILRNPDALAPLKTRARVEVLERYSREGALKIFRDSYARLTRD